MSQNIVSHVSKKTKEFVLYSKKMQSLSRVQMENICTLRKVMVDESIRSSTIHLRASTKLYLSGNRLEMLLGKKSLKG